MRVLANSEKKNQGMHSITKNLKTDPRDKFAFVKYSTSFQMLLLLLLSLPLSSKNKPSTEN